MPLDFPDFTTHLHRFLTLHKKPTLGWPRRATPSKRDAISDCGQVADRADLLVRLRTFSQSVPRDELRDLTTHSRAYLIRVPKVDP